MEQLLSYNLWANERMIETLRPIDDSIIHAERRSSFVSIYKTMLHVCDAQMVWLKRLQGESLHDWPSRNLNDNKEVLFSKLMASSKELLLLVRSGGSEFIKTKITYKNLKGDRSYEDYVETILYHVVNHGTYHRGQVTTMLRDAGVQAISNTDFIIYTRSLQGIE